MLGRVLETFDDETLGRFLTSKMAPGDYWQPNSRCFWGVAGNADEFNRLGMKALCEARSMFDATAPRRKGIREHWDNVHRGLPTFEAAWFDALCLRFGTARVAQAIRTRALNILLRRGRSVESLVSSLHATRAAHEGASA